jgi:hypothetical protein
MFKCWASLLPWRSYCGPRLKPVHGHHSFYPSRENGSLFGVIVVTLHLTYFERRHELANQPGPKELAMRKQREEADAHKMTLMKVVLQKMKQQSKLHRFKATELLAFTEGLPLMPLVDAWNKQNPTQQIQYEGENVNRRFFVA